jgi:hypothetical protein
MSLLLALVVGVALYLVFAAEPADAVRAPDRPRRIGAVGLLLLVALGLALPAARLLLGVPGLPAGLRTLEPLLAGGIAGALALLLSPALGRWRHEAANGLLDANRLVLITLSLAVASLATAAPASVVGLLARAASTAAALTLALALLGPLRVRLESAGTVSNARTATFALLTGALLALGLEGIAGLLPGG